MIVHLHVGLHKTGTTTIQETLHASRDALAGQGWLYPSLPAGDANHSATFVNAFARPRALATYRHNLSRGITDFEAERQSSRSAIQRALERDLAHVIFSGEDITWIKPRELEQLAGFLGAHEATVKPVVFVRDPIGYATSAAQESIKYGSNLQELLEAPPLPAFRQKIEPLLDLFGTDHCSIRVFQRRADLVPVFCESIGMPDQLTQQLSKVPRANTAMSTEAATLIGIANELFPNPFDAQRARNLSGWLAMIQGASFGLPARAIDYVRRESEADVAWLSDVMGYDPFPEGDQRAPVEGDPAQWGRETMESVVRCINNLSLHVEWLMNRPDSLAKSS